MVSSIIEQVEKAHLKKDAPQFSVGDTVDVHVKIVETGKERVQVFSGTVIGRKGRGINEMFTVRRIVNEEGVERIFPLHSPNVTKVDVRRTGVVRRSKLYFLRERSGKATRLREKWTGKARPQKSKTEASE